MLAPENEREAIAYLARRPYDNVFVQWLVESGSVARYRTPCAIARRDGEIAGLCYYGPQIVPCADDDAVTDALAARVRRSSPARMLVGPRPVVERFAVEARRRLPMTSIVRTSQPVYALDRTTLRGTRADAPVRRAHAHELDDIAFHSARMIANEVGRMPDARSADFLARTARIIEAGWWWRSIVDGDLVFQCNVGSATAQTAQLQGVWAPPEMRGRGHAARALGAICDRLLDEYPTLCLYVNDFNQSAIALYERVGFTRVSEFQSLLY